MGFLASRKLIIRKIFVTPAKQGFEVLHFVGGRGIMLTVKNQTKMLNKIKSVKSNFLTLVVAVLLIGGVVISPMVRADVFDEQIKQIQTENKNNKANVAQLQIQADSYQGEINRLQSQIDAIRTQIRDTETKRDDLEKQIVDAQLELDKQKALLGINIKAMYVEGDISTLEMLASSKNLSEFLDKQQYRTSVQEKIKTTLDKITELKAQLREQKTQVEKLLVDQQTMNNQLGATQAQQAGLLAYTQDQKNQYSAQIKANNANINELRRQQLIANARFLGGSPGSGPACGGGYPGSAPGPGGVWGCNYPLDYSIDTWGMYNRECVSYTAFKVAASGRYMPYWGGHGNANQWDDNARAAGIPVDGNPREGDIAQTNAGGLGHVMYVEHVYGDGTIYISQYNAGLDGRYSEKRISASGLNFIHFP